MSEKDAELTVADGATNILREMILVGTLCPGAKLHQDSLAEQLGLSRTPLRTAMARLAQQGLLEYHANRGYRVKQFSVESILQAYEARATLESEGCRIAVKQGITPEVANQLDFLVQRGIDLLAGGALTAENLAPYRQMNVEFHEAIISASNNVFIKQFVDQTYNVPLVSDRVMLWDDYEIIARSHEDHIRIAQALRDNDGHRAATIMYEHVYFAGRLLIDRLKADPETAFKHVGSFR